MRGAAPFHKPLNGHKLIANLDDSHPSNHTLRIRLAAFLIASAGRSPVCFVECIESGRLSSRLGPLGALKRP